MFLGTKLPMPDLDKEASPVCIGPRTVEMIVGHKRARGRSSPFNVQLRVRFRRKRPNSDGWYRRCQIPHCSEFNCSYFASSQDVSPDPQLLTTPAPPVWQTVEAEPTLASRLCRGFSNGHGRLSAASSLSYFPCVTKCVGRHRQCPTTVAKQTFVCTGWSPVQAASQLMVVAIRVRQLN